MENQLKPILSKPRFLQVGGGAGVVVQPELFEGGLQRPRRDAALLGGRALPRRGRLRLQPIRRQQRQRGQEQHAAAQGAGLICVLISHTPWAGQSLAVFRLNSV